MTIHINHKRLRYFREALQHMREAGDVLFWTGERIHDWYLEATG